MKKMLYALLIAVLIMPVIPAVPAEAAAKTPAPAYNGKWTYYAIYNTIYKLNSQDSVCWAERTEQYTFHVIPPILLTHIMWQSTYLHRKSLKKAGIGMISRWCV